MKTAHQKSKAYRDASERRIRAEAARVVAEVNERRIPLQVWRPCAGGEVGLLLVEYGQAELIRAVK